LNIIAQNISDFSSKSRKERHICKPIEGDALNFAIKKAEEFINSGGILITASKDEDQTHNQTYEINDMIPLLVLT
jgi:hypothetical protein